MIDPRSLSVDLRRQVRLLEDDLRGRVGRPGTDDAGRLRAEYEQAVRAGRTGATWSAWRDERLTQIAVAWVLGTVFVRFAEDNDLLAASPKLAGPGGEAIVGAENAQGRYSAAEPGPADRDWLLSSFETIDMKLAGRLLFDRRYNPLYQIMISHDAAKDLITFWRRRDERGKPVHDFTDPNWDTSFLGDLYEDLSELAHKMYALVRTPAFVAEFILGLTLRPAIEEFGYRNVKIIDPVCGSGQFVLSAFSQLAHRWMEEDPELRPEQGVQRALEAVHGVDVNPFAAAITRFRLLVAALRVCNFTTFEAASNCGWNFNIAVSDSLLENPDALSFMEPTASDLSYTADDLHEHPGVLTSGRYHVVVGNPPYLTVRDRKLYKQYRERYDACSGRYSLTVPFAQRFFQLARPANHGRGAGYVGQLAANSFMKREFGRELIEKFFAKQVALTHVIDTSGAFIPGHGTPTVILVGRNHHTPERDDIFTVVGLRGEPAIPATPELGLVWQSLLHNSSRAEQSDEWTQSFHMDRKLLQSFPWNLASNEAADVLRAMSDRRRLIDCVARIGYYANTGSDDVFTAPYQSFRRLRTENNHAIINVISGSEVRDWAANPTRKGFWPRNKDLRPVDIEQYPQHLKRLWPYRTMLGKRPNYSTRSYFEDRRRWYDWHHVTATNGVHPSITFSWVATHNHFALLREHAAPLPSAPVIELPEKAMPQDHVELVALLNSSAVCFWLKQQSNSKGRPTVDQTGSGEPWTEIYEFTATRLGELPLPAKLPTEHARELDHLVREINAVTPTVVLTAGTPTRERLTAARKQWEAVRSRMVALQEELDWKVYSLYGLVSDDDGLLDSPESIPPVKFGERAFEIVLARRVAAGRLETTWFARHGSPPVTELPQHWPTAYQNVVRRRIGAIENQAEIGILERPEFKRRWATNGWDAIERAALRDWLLDRCEESQIWFDDRGGTRHPRPLTVGQLADRLRSDRTLVEAAGMYGPGQSLTDVLEGLIANEHVPYLASLRYRGSGLLKRAQWEEVWRLQRDEDIVRASGKEDAAIQIRDKIPQPPKYSSADFLKNSYWRRRGKFDVPNERFVSYPEYLTTGEVSLRIGWAGWDYSEQAQVLADLITERMDDHRDLDRGLLPLLAGLREILPWLHQWYKLEHMRDVASGDDYAALLRECMKRLALSDSDLTAWRPPKSKRGRPPKAPKTDPSG
ncbi:MAG: BREX-2 system adenine-specific DNA-methyltransferase PglX [Pseudonocardiaceae bacterium]